jgi:hypothetical protein
MVRGSCLCGDVRYEVTGDAEEMHHCHCSRCRPGAHIFVASKAPWHTITDDLPRFDEYPPQDE